MKGIVVICSAVMFMLLVLLLGYTTKTEHAAKLQPDLCPEPLYVHCEERVPLLEAAAAGDMFKVKQLLADPGLVNMGRDCEGNTVLHVAVASGQTQIVALLVTRYPYLAKTPNASGMTPVQMAKHDRRQDLLAALTNTKRERWAKKGF